MKAALFVAWRLFFPSLPNRKLLHSGTGGMRGHPLLGAGLGIALSLIPLIVVDFFSDSMIDGIVARYRETSSYHFQAEQSKFGDWQTKKSREEWESFAAELSKRPEVHTAWVERSSFALAGGPASRDGVIVRALPEDAWTRDPLFARYIDFDSGSWELQGQSILLGRDSARRLGAAVGDSIVLLTAKNGAGGNIVPKITRLTVRGIFSTGYQDLDKTWTFVSSATGWAILPEENSRIFIGGKYKDDGYRSTRTSIELRNAYREDWQIDDWRSVNWYLMTNLEVTRVVLLIIMALIAFIGVLNVSNSILMLSLERRREIGILKCTGSSPHTITQVFTFAGLFAAFIGTVSGLSIGLIISRYINQMLAGINVFITFIAGLFGASTPPSILSSELYLQEFIVKMRWNTVILVGVLTLILAVIAAWIPSARASKLKPLEVLRKH